MRASHEFSAVMGLTYNFKFLRRRLSPRQGLLGALHLSTRSLSLQQAQPRSGENGSYKALPSRLKIKVGRKEKFRNTELKTTYASGVGVNLARICSASAGKFDLSGKSHSETYVSGCAIATGYHLSAPRSDVVSHNGTAP